MNRIDRNFSRHPQEIKRELVAAHRNKDWEAAARLSQERERAKRFRRCVVCGVPLGGDGTWCRLHYQAARYGAAALMSIMFLFGCSSQPPQVPAPVMPPMPMIPKARVMKLGGGEPKAITTWTLSWTNEPRNDALAVSGVEASADLRTWVEVWRGPYAVTNCVVLTNQPGMRFYRVCNAIP